MTKLRALLAAVALTLSLAVVTATPEPSAAASYARCYKWPYQSHASGLGVAAALNSAARQVWNAYYGTSTWTITGRYAPTSGRPTWLVTGYRWTGPTGYQSVSTECTT